MPFEIHIFFFNNVIHVKQSEHVLGLFYADTAVYFLTMENSVCIPHVLKRFLEAPQEPT